MISARLNDMYAFGEILSRQYPMSERQARKLPAIDIGGTMFYLDLRLNEFREAANFMNRLDLNRLSEIDGGYLVCFDLNTKNYFEGNKQEFDQRKDVDLVWVKLPMLHQMDPKCFEWLMQEFREGSPNTVRPHISRVYQENERNQIEMAFAKTALGYKTKNYPPLLEKKRIRKSNRKKL